MGKKRKVVEIDDEDLIQTILVRDPYGFRDPDVWDRIDHSRDDNGLYLFVEWMEWILGGAGAPGSIQRAREKGPAILNIWAWFGNAGRNELIVSVRLDIDVAPILGKHSRVRFLRKQGLTDKISEIRRAPYKTEEDVEKGTGWRPAPHLPEIKLSAVRRLLFVDPYPPPYMGISPPKGSTKRDVKLAIKQEMKPGLASVKTEIQTPAINTSPLGSVKKEPDSGAITFISAQREQVDIKPNLNAAWQSQPEVDTKPRILRHDNAASTSVNCTSARIHGPVTDILAKAEPEGQEVENSLPNDMLAQIHARRAQDLISRLSDATMHLAPKFEKQDTQQRGEAIPSDWTAQIHARPATQHMDHRVSDFLHPDTVHHSASLAGGSHSSKQEPREDDRSIKRVKIEHR